MTTPISTSQPSQLQIEQTNLRYLLNLIKDEVKREINCHAVGTIQTLDPTTMTCTVNFNYQKVLKQSSYTAPNPTAYVDPIINYPTLVRVPIVVLGGGGAYTTYPISGVVTNAQGQVTYPGDTCLLLFCDRDIDLWLELNGVNNPPNTQRMHDLSDAVAIVGLYPTNQPIANYDTKNIVTNNPNGQVLITDETGEKLLQSGMMMAYAGATAPSGWLLCQGQSVSTTTYALLFAVIGYTYGGSGGNFNLPNMQGNVAVGLKSGDPYFGSLGDTAGAETVTLVNANLPTTAYFGNNTEPVSQSSADVTVPTNATHGSSAPIEVIQPSLVVNWIIKI